MIKRYHKVFTIGDRYTEGLFDAEVSITEKVDGSQLNVCLDSKQGLVFLTKGSTTHLGDNNRLFHPAVAYFHTIDGKLKTDWTYHGETLANPRHNTLTYGRVPKNHFALYAVTKPDGTAIVDHKQLSKIAMELDVDVVPELFNGRVDKDLFTFLNELLNTTSYLGNVKIEGIVAKRGDKEIFVGGQLLPFVQGKFVSDEFKEKHKVAWPTNNKSPLVVIGDMVRTEARWMKAIQRLKENGEWEQHPRDIGKALKYLHLDLEQEDKEDIKERLWQAFSKDIKRAATRGFPEAYKYWLATGVMKVGATGEDYEDAGVT